MNKTSEVSQSMPKMPPKPPKVSDSLSTTNSKGEKETVPLSTTNSNNLSDDVLAILNHPKAKQKLKPQELEFVKYYHISKNPRIAATKAGYSDGVARTTSYKWISSVFKSNTKPWIFATLHAQSPKIEARAAEKAEKLVADCAALDIVADKIDAQYVLNKTAEHISKNNGEIPTHFKRSVDPETNEEIFTPVYAYNATAVGKGLDYLANIRT